MNSMDYDSDSLGGLMPQILALTAPPGCRDIREPSQQNSSNSVTSSQWNSNDNGQNKGYEGGLAAHPYFKRPGKGHNHDCCDSCGEGGDLICCDLCPASFHLTCHDPPLFEDDLPSGEWACHQCRMARGEEKALNALNNNNNNVSTSNSKATTTLPGKAIKISKKKEKSDQKGKSSEDEKVFAGGREITVSNTPLATLIKAVAVMNPVQFSLPDDMTLPSSFPGEPKDIIRKFSRKGSSKKKPYELDNGVVPLPAKLCFLCNKSCRVGPMIPCDYCPLFFHLDCLDPPLTTPPMTLWMCPNHPEHYMDMSLLTSHSLTERVKLWDKFSTPVDQNSIKLSFFRRCHRNDPPFRYKVKRALRSRIRVPGAVKAHYKDPPDLMPHLSPSQYLHLPLPFEDPTTTTADSSSLSLFKSFAHRKSLSSIPASSSNKFRSDDSCESSVVDPFLDLPSRLRDSKWELDESKDLASDSKMEETSSLSSNSTTISKDLDEGANLTVVKKTQSSITEERKLSSIVPSSEEFVKENCEETQLDIGIKREVEYSPEISDLSNDLSESTKTDENVHGKIDSVSSLKMHHSLQSSKVGGVDDDLSLRSEQQQQQHPLMTQSTYDKSQESLICRPACNEEKQDSSPNVSSINGGQTVQERMSQYSFIPTDEEKNEWLTGLLKMQSSIIKHLSHGSETKGNPNANSLSWRNNSGNAGTKSTSSLTAVESKKPFMLNGDLSIHSSKPKYSSRLSEVQNAHESPLSPAVGYLEAKSKNCLKTQKKRSSFGTTKQRKLSLTNALSESLSRLETSLKERVQDDDLDIPLSSLDQAVVDLLAYERLKEILEPKRPHVVKSLPEVAARALLCPLVPQVTLKDFVPKTAVKYSSDPIAMKFRVLHIGKGTQNHVNLGLFGHCNFVSPHHASIVFDEATGYYELLNYSEFSSKVDGVTYHGDFSQHTLSQCSTPSLLQQVRDIIACRRKEKKEANLEFSSSGPAMSCRPGEDFVRCDCNKKSNGDRSDTGWEGAAILHHGSYIRFGCLKFVFSIVEEASKGDWTRDLLTTYEKFILDASEEEENEGNVNKVEEENDKAKADEYVTKRVLRKTAEREKEHNRKCKKEKDENDKEAIIVVDNLARKCKKDYARHDGGVGKRVGGKREGTVKSEFDTGIRKKR